MKNPLNELLASLSMNELCSECESWTEDECDECGEAICEDCHEQHSNDHYSDQQDEDE